MVLTTEHCPNLLHPFIHLPSQQPNGLDSHRGSPFIVFFIHPVVILKQTHCKLIGRKVRSDKEGKEEKKIESVCRLSKKSCFNEGAILNYETILYFIYFNLG